MATANLDSWLVGFQICNCVHNPYLRTGISLQAPTKSEHILGAGER